MTQVTKTYESANVTEEAIERFHELNSALKPKWRFMVLRLSEDELSLYPQHCEPISDSIKCEHEHMLDLLPYQDPCWIAYNFEYRVIGGGKRNKVVFINWVPDTLTRETLKESARVKMMAVTRNGVVKKTLRGAVCTIQGNSPEDVQYTSMLGKIARYEREPVDHDWVAEQGLVL